MEIKISDLKELCNKILMKNGLTKNEAEIITDDYVDAEMRGKPSHGIAAFSVVANGAKIRGHAKLEFEKGNLAFFNGNDDIGHLVAREALKWAKNICKIHSTAIVGMKNIQRFATPGSIARLASLEGLISIIFEYGGQAFMAPYGSADAIISTNPIGIGIPTKSDPILLDMALSEKAYYFIPLAKKLGKKIPSSWGIDSDGKPTTDPGEVKAVSPFGGYKGYGLAFMLEILTGPLLGVDVGLSGKIGRRGALLFFLNPSAFGVPFIEFEKRVKKLISDVKSSRVAPNFNEVFVPGEQGNEKRNECIKKGTIELEESIWSDLHKLLD